jgi:hypothetical protein
MKHLSNVIMKTMKTFATCQTEIHPLKILQYSQTYGYTNQINFISFPYAHVYLPLSIFIIFLNLILLLGPAYHHYKQFKNNKILLLYVVSVIGCTTMFVYYLQQNEIEE